MSTTIVFDWSQLSTVVIGLFVAVGFFRGVAREVFTSLALLLLNYTVVNPNIARSILDWANSILNLFRVVITNPQARVSAQGLFKAYSEAPPIVTADNAYQFFIILLVIIVALSYLTGGKVIGQEGLSPLSRIVGGLLGFLNGTMILSLFKDYILGTFIKTGTAAVSAQVLVPRTLAFEVQNVPTQPALREGGTLLLIAVVIITILLLAVGNRFKLQFPLSRR